MSLKVRGYIYRVFLTVIAISISVMIKDCFILDDYANGIVLGGIIALLFTFLK